MSPIRAAGPAHRAQQWYGAYMEALFEPDPRRIAERIKLAQQLIVIRTQQLVPSRGEVSERRALDTALQALDALQMCIRG